MLAVAVLAAGKGTRKKSDLPKVLQPLAGATLVERVLGSCHRLAPDRQLLVVGHQADRVERTLAGIEGLELRAILPAADEPERWSAGTAASFTPVTAHPSLRPLEPFEREHLASRAGVPYRDPTGTDTAAAILARRRREQERSDAPPARLPRRPGPGGLGHAEGHR